MVGKIRRGMVLSLLSALPITPKAEMKVGNSSQESQSLRRGQYFQDLQDGFPSQVISTFN